MDKKEERKIREKEGENKQKMGGRAEGRKRNKARRKQ
jgi:hypothetical protein